MSVWFRVDNSHLARKTSFLVLQARPKQYKVCQIVWISCVGEGPIVVTSHSGVTRTQKDGGDDWLNRMVAPTWKNQAHLWLVTGKRWCLGSSLLPYFISVSHFRFPLFVGWSYLDKIVIRSSDSLTKFGHQAANHLY